MPESPPAESPTLPPAPFAEATTLPPTEPQLDDRAVGVPTVAGYELLGELGRGGMGVVYKARQVSLNRLVALKMILAGGHAGEAELQRFKAEAEAVARLQHPNIVQIHEVGQSEGRPFFSLEFVDGGSLAARLDGTPWAARPAAQIIETLARAMHAAHQQGIIHRDLKPANVLLASPGPASPGRQPGESFGESPVPKITDFGLAKQMNSASPGRQSGEGLTATGAVLGTPSYMAPEQAGGKRSEVGPAADVYSLGAILYELLTGRPPFRAETPLDTVLQVVTEEPVPPRRLVPKLPRDLETICLKCLEKSPARRFATAAELADDLERWRNTRPIRARRIGPVGRTVRWCRRNPVLAAVCSLAVVIILTLSAVYYASLLRENKHTRDARDQAERDRDQAEAAREHGQDTLARSLYEQAHALRLAHQPGWRWQALDLLRESEKLRARPRRTDLPPIEEADQPGPLSRLQSQGELRREAAAALLLDDARPAPPISISGSPGKYREVSGDGRRALAVFMRQPEKLGAVPPMGLHLFDLTNGQQLRELLIPNVHVTATALSPDGTILALTEPGLEDVQLRDLPGGTPRATLQALKAPGLPVAAHTYDPLVFSPDGRYLAAVRDDGKKADIFLWDLPTPPRRATWPGLTHLWAASVSGGMGGCWLIRPAATRSLWPT